MVVRKKNSKTKKSWHSSHPSSKNLLEARSRQRTHTHTHTRAKKKKKKKLKKLKKKKTKRRRKNGERKIRGR